MRLNHVKSYYVFGELMLSIMIALLLTSCGLTNRQPEWREAQGVVWATTYHIKYKAPVDLTDSIIATMKRVEMSLSSFDDESRISHINRGEDMMTDSLIQRVFAKSVEVNRLSRGLFDPTVGPLVDLWGFGKQKSNLREPSDSAIAAALGSVGIAQCSINADGLMIKKRKDTRFNFSAITKGLGCDEVAATLKRGGATDWMVEIGGELALYGKNPDGKDWTIMIDAPVADTTATHEGLLKISLTDCGVATSGNYRNFHDTSKGRVGHIISPVTGKPYAGEILSATIKAPDCMTADAFATATMMMSLDSAMAMIERLPDVEAMFVTGKPPYKISFTPGFPKPEKL